MWNCSEMTSASPAIPFISCVAGAEMLSRIGVGLSRLVEDGARLQEAVASARQNPEAMSLTEALQGLDYITQRLEAFASVVHELRTVAPSDWHVDARGLSGGIGLENLRLELLGRTAADYSGGTVELW